MKYKSKGYVFDEEVTAWLEKLKAMHGSYNKGLRLIAFPADRQRRVIDVEPEHIRAELPPARELTIDLDTDS